MSDLDQHLASIEDLLAGKTRPIFDENNPQARFPAPPESAVQYRPPSGTYDGAMDLKPRIDMSKFAMPIFGQEDAEGNPVTKAAPRPPLAVLGGRNTPLMMNSSPPDNDEGVASTPPTGGTPATLRDNGGTSWNSPVTPGTWGTGDLPSRAPQGGDDMISLLRGLFQGAL